MRIFADDNVLGNKDFPGPEDVYLGVTFAVGVACMMVAFKNQITSVCGSGKGSSGVAKVAPKQQVEIRSGSAAGTGLDEPVAPGDVVTAVPGKSSSAGPQPPYALTLDRDVYRNLAGTVVASKVSIKPSRYGCCQQSFDRSGSKRRSKESRILYLPNTAD